MILIAANAHSTNVILDNVQARVLSHFLKTVLHSGSGQAEIDTSYVLAAVGIGATPHSVFLSLSQIAVVLDRARLDGEKDLPKDFRFPEEVSDATEHDADCPNHPDKKAKSADPKKKTKFGETVN